MSISGISGSNAAAQQSKALAELMASRNSASTAATQAATTAQAATARVDKDGDHDSM